MTQSSDSDVGSDTSTLEYTQESFETYRLKIIQLCIDIGLGTPTEVERMAGGSFNRIVGVAFSLPNGQTSQQIIRIPRFPLTSSEVQNIEDQVAVLLYLSKDLPVAKVVAYDCTAQNAINCQYVVQERLPGQSIETVYDTLSLDERLQLATAVAELMKSIESVILPKFGRLVRGTPMPNVSHDVSLLPSQGIDITGYRLNFSTDIPTTSENSLLSLLQAMCKSRKEEDKDDKELLGYWQKLQEMITEMELVGLLSNTKEDARLGHWDLSAQNVLVHKVNGIWTVSGVLDWDDALSVPKIIGRKPPVWLWLPEVRVEEADITPTVSLTEEQKLIKERFDEALIVDNPSFLDDAYHRGKWLRRLWTFALHGFSYSQDWDRYMSFIPDWDDYYAKAKSSKLS